MTAPRAEIRSTANPRIKAAIRLRDRRERETLGLTIVDGAREVLRAVHAGVPVEAAFVCEARCRTEECHKVMAAVHDATPVSEGVLDRLAFGDRADGIVALIRTPSTALDRLVPPHDPLIVVLEGVEKPGNVGAVLRSADAAGAAGVLLADPRTDAFNPNVIRASLGTVFHVPIGTGTADEVLAWLRANGVGVFAARVDATREYTTADLTGATALVLGSETRGLSATWEGEEIVPIRLPMLGVADSLNVSVAAGVLLYEARRQRNAPHIDDD